MAKPTAAELAGLLSTDNRSVVGSADPAAPTDPDKAYVASALGPNGQVYKTAAGTALDAIDKDPADTDDPVTDWKAGIKAVTPVTAPGDTIIEIPLKGTGAAGVLTRNDVRTQYFNSVKDYSAQKPAFGATQVYVNQFGEPLDDTGKPDEDPANWADAAVGGDDLTVPAAAWTPPTGTTTSDYWTKADDPRGKNKFLGPVTNYAQVHRTDGSRTPVPGRYQASARQTSLYAPYVGWTAQQDKP